jgi:hypothetical protein
LKILKQQQPSKKESAFELLANLVREELIII